MNEINEAIDNEVWETMNWIKCPECDAYMEHDDYKRGGNTCLNCNAVLLPEDSVHE